MLSLIETSNDLIDSFYDARVFFILFTIEESIRNGRFNNKKRRIYLRRLGSGPASFDLVAESQVRPSSASSSQRRTTTHVRNSVTLIPVTRRGAVGLLSDRRRRYRSRRRRRRWRVRRAAQEPDGDGSRRRERAADRRGVAGDAASARGAYAARGRSKSRWRLDITRWIATGWWRRSGTTAAWGGGEKDTDKCTRERKRSGGKCDARLLPSRWESLASGTAGHDWSHRVIPRECWGACVLPFLSLYILFPFVGCRVVAPLHGVPLARALASTERVLGGGW